MYIDLSFKELFCWNQTCFFLRLLCQFWQYLASRWGTWKISVKLFMKLRLEHHTVIWRRIYYSKKFIRRLKLYPHVRWMKKWVNLCYQNLGITEYWRLIYELIDIKLNEHRNCSVSSPIYCDLVWTFFSFWGWMIFSVVFLNCECLNSEFENA